MKRNLIVISSSSSSSTMNSSVSKQQDQIAILGNCRTVIYSDRNSGAGQDSKRQKLTTGGVVENNANSNTNENANLDTEDPQLRLLAPLSSAAAKFSDQYKQQRKQEEEETEEEQQQQQQRQEAPADNPSTNEKKEEREATRNINSRSDDILCEENNYNVYRSYEIEFPENVAASSSISKADEYNYNIQDYGHLANPPRLLTANEFPESQIESEMKHLGEAVGMLRAEVAVATDESRTFELSNAVV